MLLRCLLPVAFAASASALQCWQPEPPANVSHQFAPNSQLPPHPRLRVNDKQLRLLNQTIHSDSIARAYLDGLIVYGESWLDAPHVDCNASHMSNTQSRTTLTIQYNLGLLWRLTGEERYAERAASELLHVTTKCTTWDPWGLALAEMTCVQRLYALYRERSASPPSPLPHRARYGEVALTFFFFFCGLPIGVRLSRGDTHGGK